MKKIILIVVMLCAGVVLAEGTFAITEVTAQQRYPWNGSVDIVVTIQGDTNIIANTECIFVATNSATQTGVLVSTISQMGTDLFANNVCTRHYLWNAAIDIGEVKIDDVAFTVNIARALGGVQLWENGPYWAECNVGASKPEEYGYYFWWGDAVGYSPQGGNLVGHGYYQDVTWVSSSGVRMSNSPFSSSTCPTYDKDYSTLQSLGYIDSTGSLVAAHDAATVHFGMPWRIPNSSEAEALISNCTAVWTSRNGVFGMLVTGKGSYASRSIFLPAVGEAWDTEYYPDDYADYWTSTISSAQGSFPTYFRVQSGNFSMGGVVPYAGGPVRPIREFSQTGISDIVGHTTHLSLDCQTGIRMAKCVETITYSSEWEKGGDIAKVLVNGEVIASETGAGMVNWEPHTNGIYTLAHQVMIGDDVHGEILSAQFKVEHFAAVSIKNVTAKQRYPWNGLVDIVVTLQGSAEDVAKVDCWFVATNNATRTALTVAHITPNGGDVGSGTKWMRKFVWNASADVGAVKIEDVTLAVDTVTGGVQLWEGGPYWAMCNVGATKPEEYGYYFWWGDTVGYKRNASNNGWVSVRDGSAFEFRHLNCPTWDKDNSTLQSLGYIDSTGNFVAAHDAATAQLGAPWRMPTDAEFSVLLSNCDTTWTTKNGVYGRLVTGRGAYASKSIFLSAAGYGNGSDFYGAGSYGYYWSSTPGSGDSIYAWYLLFGSSSFNRDYSYRRRHGQSVRPLREFAK